jgi:hypothetical protein
MFSKSRMKYNLSVTGRHGWKVNAIQSVIN